MAGGTAARDQKEVADCRGVLVFEDEASFWLDGTLHQTWSPIGVQPRVPTYGLRKTAHVFGAVAVDDAATHRQSGRAIPQSIAAVAVAKIRSGVDRLGQLRLSVPRGPDSMPPLQDSRLLMPFSGMR